MNKNQESLKHCALTKFLCRHDLRRAYDLRVIIENCDVNPHVGCLPIELRALIDKKDLSETTLKFYDILDSFIIQNYDDLSKRAIKEYELKTLTDLLKTKCILYTCIVLDKCDDIVVYKELSGAVSDVYKLSFPEMGVDYALKVFKNNIMPTVGMGPFYEIPVAIKANKCEPKLNNPLYMANLGVGQWTLNKWVNQTDNESVPTPRKNAIFITACEDENKPRNYCDGKRIDFGKTRKTLYGGASYQVRKLYRQMQNMTSEQLSELAAKKKNNFEQENYRRAQDIIYMEYINEKCRQ